MKKEQKGKQQSTKHFIALWPISVSRDDNSSDMEKDMH
jgi:hypothetical protein